MAIALLVMLVLMVPTVDSRDLDSEVTVLRNDVTSLKILTAYLRQQAYFKATFSNSAQKLEAGTVVFDKVLEFIGNAYNPSSGVFTTDIRGVYMFVVQSFNYGTDDTNWDLYLNGQIILHSDSITRDRASHSYSYPLVLNIGDKVWVHNHNALYAWTMNHSFFSGLLLRAMP